jgi:hypothetical protein
MKKSYMGIVAIACASAWIVTAQQPLKRVDNTALRNAGKNG